MDGPWTDYAPSDPLPPPPGAPDSDQALPPGIDPSQVLTIRGSNKAQPAAQPAGADANGSAGPWNDYAPSMSLADAGVVPKPDAGPLTNTGNEGFWSGLGKGAATGIIKGVADAIGFAGNLHDLADYLVSRGESAITGEDPQKIMQEIAAKKARIGLPKDPSGQAIAAPVLAKTGEYVPDSGLGRIGETALETAVGTIGPGGGALVAKAAPAAALRATAAMMPSTAAAGAAGQAATDFTGDPLAGMGAGLVAGAVPSAGLNALRKVARPIAANFSDTIRRNMAGEDLVHSAQDPAAAQQVLAQPDANAIPGSNPTTGQLTGDLGLLAREKAARNSSPENAVPFTQRYQEQNTAQRTALQDLAPEDADAMDAARLYKGRRTRLDTKTQAELDAATQAAQGEAARIGPTADPSAVGQQLRGQLEAGRLGAKVHRGLMYSAVDPEGNLHVAARGIREAAERIGAEADPFGAPRDAAEQDVFKIAGRIPDVFPYKRLNAFDQYVTQTMKAERKANGESAAWRRLSLLKGAVQDAMNKAEQHAAVLEEERVAAEAAREQADRVQYEVRGAEPVRAVAGGGSRPAPVNRERAGSKLITPKPAASDRPLSLTEYLASIGGLARTPELKAIFGRSNPMFSGLGRLMRSKGGLSLEDALTNARQGRYLTDPGDLGRGPLQTDTNTLLDALEKEHYGGHKLYPPDANAEAWHAATERRKIEGDLRRVLIDKGFKPEKISRETVERAVDLIHSGEETDPALAFERAGAQRSESRVAGEHDARLAETGPVETFDVPDDAGGAPAGGHAPDGAGRPGGEGAGGGEIPAGYDGSERSQGWNAPPAVTPNFDEAAAERLKAAKAVAQDYGRTYREGPVKDVLATHGFADNYTLPPSAVPARAFVKGDRGYDTMRAFLKAANNSPHAIEAIKDYALNGLRGPGNMLPVGTLKPSAFEKWRHDYAPALKALDEASPGFADEFSSAAKATDAMLAAGINRKGKLEEFEKSAAGRFLGLTDRTEVEKTLASILTAKDGPTRVGELVKGTKRSPGAVEGLRRAGIDWLMRRASNGTENGTSGEKVLSGIKLGRALTESDAALRKLYGDTDVNTMRRVAGDMERTSRSFNANRTPGGSDTAQNLGGAHGAMHKLGEAAAHPASLMGAVIAGGYLGFHEHGFKGSLIGAGTGAGAYLVNTLRSAGLSKVDDLVRAALLDPQLARDLMGRVSVDRPDRWKLAAARAIRRSLLVTPETVQSKDNR